MARASFSHFNDHSSSSRDSLSTSVPRDAASSGFDNSGALVLAEHQSPGTPLQKRHSMGILSRISFSSLGGSASSSSSAAAGGGGGGGGNNNNNNNNNSHGSTTAIGGNQGTSNALTTRDSLAAGNIRDSMSTGRPIMGSDIGSEIGELVTKLDSLTNDNTRLVKDLSDLRKKYDILRTIHTKTNKSTRELKKEMDGLKASDSGTLRSPPMSPKAVKFCKLI